jgi:hypothetical protein
MKRVFLIGVIAAAFLGTGERAYAGACLSPEEAQKHVGENTCVCGIVASTHYASLLKFRFHGQLDLLFFCRASRRCGRGRTRAALNVTVK